MNRSTIGGGVSLLLLLIASHAHASGFVQLPVTKDNSIVMVDGEWSDNAGQNGRLRIKGNQHIVAIAFDMSAVVGKRVKKATLVCAQGEQAISGLTLSTIATAWDENRSNGLICGVDEIVDWGYPGARFPAVIGGNSFTLVAQSDSDLREGEYRWDVPVDMVHAIAIGIAHGLALHEHEADYGRNPTVFSHEQSAKKPYLLVEFSDETDPLPKPPMDLQLISTDSDFGNLVLKAPAHGFAYEVLIDGEPLGRHNIPLVSPDSTQSISLRDLSVASHREPVSEIVVVTLSRSGQRSEPSVLRTSIPGTSQVAQPKVAISPAQTPPIADLGIIPVTDKYDQAGQPVGDLPSDYRTHNAIFNGQRVHLRAAAGEVIGFQMLLRGQGDVTLKVALDSITPRIDLLHAVHVPADGRSIPDPLLPLPEKLRLKQESDQVIIADIYIPFDSHAGLRQGTISISDGRVVPLEVEVLPFSLPRQATFFCEMNSYGLPDHVNEYYSLQQIAYDHRVHANILHYSHNSAAAGTRKSNLDMRLATGKRMDNKRYDDVEPDATKAYWDDFVEAFGPFIDGTLFRDGHRGPIPAPGFYLTFHESWPLNCRPYFNGNLDAYEAFSDQPAYARTYVNVLKDFTSLAKTKGWTGTGFQVYFNNKGSLGELTKAPWILDEPSGYWDYRALQFYGELTDAGREVSPEVNIDYRIDISRPEYCRGQLAQRGDLWVVSSTAFQQYRRLVTDRMQRDGLKAWVYGTSNHVHDSNRNVQAWVLDAWKDGATGIVPWQTVDKTGNALKEADQLGLFIFDQDQAGQPVIRHSLRLKAFRDAEQLVEYLNLLKEQSGWSQDQMRRFVCQYVDLNAQVDKADDADAGTSDYDRVSAASIENLKLATIELLVRPAAILGRETEDHGKRAE